jgi:SAM-dependent methyltransferase
MGFDYRKLRLGARAIRGEAYKQHLGGGAAQWERRGQFQLALLRHLGLVESSRVLDVGCGPLRGGLPIIHFVGARNYRGFDANRSLVEAAHFELERAGLREAIGHVTLLEDFALGTLAARYDVVLCFSVLNHCTPDERARFFAAVPAVMAPASFVVVTHATWFAPEVLAGTGLRVAQRFVAESDLPASLAPQQWGFPAGDGGPLPILVIGAGSPPP